MPRYVFHGPAELERVWRKLADRHGAGHAGERLGRMLGMTAASVTYRRRTGMWKARPGQRIDMISEIRVGDAEARARDALGRFCAYFPARLIGPGERGADRRVASPQKLGQETDPIGSGSCKRDLSAR